VLKNVCVKKMTYKLGVLSTHCRACRHSPGTKTAVKADLFAFAVARVSRVDDRAGTQVASLTSIHHDLIIAEDRGIADEVRARS